jgi:hypothetical protein
MKNDLIVFTQDTPGERAWLAQKYSGYRLLETINSGLWPTNIPVNISQGMLYEISDTDTFHHDQLINCNIPTTKSVFNFNAGMHSKNWIYADALLSNVNFSSPLNTSEKFQLCTFARTGTLFLRSILLKNYKELSEPINVSSVENNFASVNFLKENPVNNIILYRKDLWGWLTSKFIGETISKGLLHYDDDFNWAEADPHELSEIYISNKQKEFIHTWNFFCNLRAALPAHTFYLLEFSENIEKYKNFTIHDKINYDKSKLISNLSDAKKIFEDRYEKNWQAMQNRCCQHLYSMGCLSSLDNLIVNL